MIAVGDLKTCSNCRESLPLKKFGKNKRQPDGYQNYCANCRTKYFFKWYRDRRKDPGFCKQEREKERRVRLSLQLRKHGVSVEEYDRLVAAGCATCGGPPRGRGRYHFDHDHKTGKFRGLLCHACNTALGLFKDDVDLLTRVIEYLRKARD